ATQRGWQLLTAAFQPGTLGIADIEGVPGDRIAFGPRRPTAEQAADQRTGRESLQQARGHLDEGHETDRAEQQHPEQRIAVFRAGLDGRRDRAGLEESAEARHHTQGDVQQLFTTTGGCNRYARRAHRRFSEVAPKLGEINRSETLTTTRCALTRASHTLQSRVSASTRANSSDSDTRVSRPSATTRSPCTHTSVTACGDMANTTLASRFVG